MNKAPMGADMMSRIYHQQRGGAQMYRPLSGPQGLGAMLGGSAPMHQQPQGMGPMMGMAQQQMGVAPRPQMQRGQLGQGYNAGGSGAMNAIIAQLMQRKGG
jgi:hypothetical protein